MLDRLILQDFRSYRQKELGFGEGVTWIVGPNAVGKTNILEALRMLSVGESFRAKRIDETVHFEGEFGKIKAKLVDEKGQKTELAIILTRGELQGKRVAKRKFFVGEIAKRKSDFLGIMPSVVFRPEDLELVDGSPTIRRSWLNEILSQVSREYGRSLATYEQANRRRNKILEAIREGIANRYQLTFWDGLLIKHGQALTEARQDLVAFINDVWEKSDLFCQLKLVYEPSLISESRLAQYKNEEVAAGHTLVGPHKDDWSIRSQISDVRSQERNISIYGSRGEQRMAVLGLKMGELLFLEDKLKKKPILLLDDIFSELDEEHTREVQRVMIGRQVVVTTTDKKEVGGGGKVIQLKHGGESL